MNYASLCNVDWLEGVSIRIDLLENDPTILEMLEIALSLRGHTVAGYADPFEFLRAFLSENTYDVLLVDYRPGADFLGDLVVRVVRPNIPRVLMSTTPRSWFDTRLSALSDVPFLKKPFHLRDLFAAIDRCYLAPLSTAGV
jgi:DNA-binding response OmpR family regulator